MMSVLIQRRCVIKQYDKLKAEMEKIQQQMAKAKKNKRAGALKETMKASHQDFLIKRLRQH